MRKEGVNGAIDPTNIKIYNQIIKPNSENNLELSWISLEIMQNKVVKLEK